MNRSRRSAPFLLALLLAAPALGAEAKPAEPAAAPSERAKAIAVVTEVSGKATATSQPGGLHRLARLAAGEVVRTERGAALQLAFASGRRYRLGEASAVTLGSADLAERSGAVEALPSVPPFPAVPPIVDGGSSSASLRIRGSEITGISPHCTAVPAGEIRLAWDPPARAGAYRVEIYDARGEVAYRLDGLTAPAAVVPAAALPTGQKYAFKVETTDLPGSQATGRGRFAILPGDTTDAYRELRAALATGADAPAWTLLAAVDRQLGLRREERDDLRAALALAPDDPGLTAALAEVERKLTP